MSAFAYGQHVIISGWADCSSNSAPMLMLTVAAILSASVMTPSSAKAPSQQDTETADTYCKRKQAFRWLVEIQSLTILRKRSVCGRTSTVSKAYSTLLNLLACDKDGGASLRLILRCEAQRKQR